MTQIIDDENHKIKKLIPEELKEFVAETVEDSVVQLRKIIYLKMDGYKDLDEHLQSVYLAFLCKNLIINICFNSVRMLTGNDDPKKELKDIINGLKSIMSRPTKKEEIKKCQMN